MSVIRVFTTVGIVLAACVGLLTHGAALAQDPSLEAGYVVEGIGFVAPGQWTAAGVRASNPTDEAQTLLSVMGFDLEPNVQFGREIWIPPRSQRRMTHLVRGPSRVPADARSVDVTSLLIGGATNEVALSRVPKSLMPSFQPRKLTGILRGRPEGGRRADASDLLAAMRASQGLSRRTAFLRSDGVPTAAAALEPLHSLVLASDELDLSPLQLRSLRGWLIRGGRLWIPLDAVDPELPRELLGDAWTPVRIDEVALTRVALRGPREGRDAPDDVREVQSDTPWTLQRYTPGDAEVTHRVGDWPAVMRLRVGKGEVFLTTLSADAWVDAMSREEREAAENSTLGVKASPPLARFAAAFYAQPGGGVLNPQPTEQAAGDRAMRSFAAERIGYDVMPRGPMVMLLVTLPVLLLGAAVWLQRRHRLEAVGIVGVSAAVVLAGVVLIAGSIHAGRVPRTLASLQQVNVSTEPPIASTRSHLALYSPSRERGTIRGRGGVAWPDSDALRGELARMIWSDADRWRWDGIEAPAKAILGLEHMRTLDTPQPTAATAAFAPQGLAGRIAPGRFTGIEDAVLATPSGVLPLALEADGRFTAPADTPPWPGGYIRGATLSQTQQRRQRIYERLLRSSTHGDGPTLLAFADAVELDVTLSTEARRVAEAIVSWPLTLERPEPGQAIRVPAALVRAQPLSRLRGAGVMGSLYNPATGKWISTSTPADLAVRFTAPEAVVPLELRSATLWLDLDAPGWDVEIATPSDGSMRTLATLRGPRGRTRVELDAGDGLELDEAGEAVVVIRVKPQPADTSMSQWQLHQVGLSLTGETRHATPPGISPEKSPPEVPLHVLPESPPESPPEVPLHVLPESPRNLPRKFPRSPTMSQAPAVQTHELTKRYGEFTALDSLSLTLERGQILGFIGPNGAGKTTTIKILVGLSRPTERLGENRRRRLHRPGRPDQVHGRLHARHLRRLREHARPRVPRLLRRRLQDPPQATPQARRGGHGRRRLRLHARPLHRVALPRHEAARRHRTHPAPRPPAAHPRRAGQRPRSQRPHRDARDPAQARRHGQDPHRHQPHPPRALAHLLGRGHDHQRQAPRFRHARRHHEEPQPAPEDRGRAARRRADRPGRHARRVPPRRRGRAVGVPVESIIRFSTERDDQQLAELLKAMNESGVSVVQFREVPLDLEDAFVSVTRATRTIRARSGGLRKTR